MKLDKKENDFILKLIEFFNFPNFALTKKKTCDNM